MSSVIDLEDKKQNQLIDINTYSILSSLLLVHR